MDPQYATIDPLAEITDTMASLWDAILGLGQRIDGHQAPPAQILGSTPHDSTAPPLPLPLSGPTVQQDYIVHHHHHHHHHLFSQPHELKLLYFMVRLRPCHILLWPLYRLLMTLRPVLIGLSSRSGSRMFLMEL